MIKGMSDKTARGPSRQGVQPLRAFGSLIGSAMAAQRIYTHYFLISSLYSEINSLNASRS